MNIKNTFSLYYIDVWKKYLDFSGRSDRPEYWMFTLFNFIVCFFVGFISGLFDLLILNLFFYVSMLPAIAVSVRRLHDTGRDFKWIFIALIPVIGAIVLIWFLIQKGSPENNQYGAPPEPVRI